MTLLATSLNIARSLYRVLPMGIRREAGKFMRLGLDPLLAARMPRAEAGMRLPQEAASLIGLLSSPIGHGVAARLMAKELQRDGVALSLQDLTEAVGAPADAELKDAGAAGGDGRGAAILVMNPDTSIHALARAPSGLLRGRRVIGYWVWELDLPPAHWRKARNLVHEVWTPSHFSAAAMRLAFDVPVHVVPHPVALDPPPAPTEETRAEGRRLAGARPDDFVAVSSFSLASSLARKNPFGLIKAFEDAFDGDPGAVLVLRASGQDRYPGAGRMLEAAAKASRAKVVLLDARGGLKGLHALYAGCDVYASLHRSEGFGLNLAEAMLCERAVLATGWSGNLDFMTEACSALVPATLTPVRDPQGIYQNADARWAEPDHDAAVEMLRRLRRDADWRRALGRAGAQHARETLGGGAAARILRTLG